MDLLSELKDIHLPPPVENWPWAIGWYVVLIVGLIGAIFLAWTIYQRWEGVRARRYTLNRLNQLKLEYAYEEDPVAIAIELSQLLRRSALAIYPRNEVAGLKSEAWLAFLDRTGKTHAFTLGSGRALVSAPYQSLSQSGSKYHVDELFNVVASWVKFNLPGFWGRR